MTPQDSPEARIAEIREREQKATAGPWRSISGGNCQTEDGLLHATAEVEGLPRPWNPVWAGWQVAKNYFKTFMRQEDADFVAHSREDIRWLLGRLHEQAQEIERLKDELMEAQSQVTLYWKKASESFEHFQRAEAAESALAAAQREIAELREREKHRHEWLHVNARPDGGYALRILRAYREQCNTRWSSGGNILSVGGEDNPLMRELNRYQDERAIELDAAIAELTQGHTSPSLEE